MANKINRIDIFYGAEQFCRWQTAAGSLISDISFYNKPFKQELTLWPTWLDRVESRSANDHLIGANIWYILCNCCQHLIRTIFRWRSLTRDHFFHQAIIHYRPIHRSIFAHCTVISHSLRFSPRSHFIQIFTIFQRLNIQTNESCIQESTTHGPCEQSFASGI